MITQSICFVIGAGASNCYEFPLGKQLCAMTVDELPKNTGTHHLLIENTSLSPQAVETFRSELFLSGQNSVDAFLEMRQEYLHIGKAAMATILLRYERPDTLWRFNANNWMRYLLDHMRAPTIEKFAENNVSFVTFNFDRSLEHFLFTSLKNTYGASEEECAAVTDRLKIIHLHGRLGYLPWQGKKLSRPYIYEISPQILDMCVRDIKLVHEELADGRDKDFENAKLLMQSANRTYFLGFGFGQLNIDRLNLKGMPTNRGTATAHGFTQSEVDAINGKIDGRISIYPNHDIDSLFRNVVNWK